MPGSGDLRIAELLKIINDGRALIGLDSGHVITLNSVGEGVN